MQKFDIYGLGNALVDTEIEVTADQLKEFGIEKGIMTLVDEDRLLELRKSFHDGVHSQACGGSAANTIIGATQLGANCFYSCKVAEDDTGNFYLDDLLSSGVRTNLENGSLSNGTTGTCLVFVTPDADRTMNTYLGISSRLSETELNPEHIGNSEYLYIEGYLVTSPTAMNAAVKAKEIADKHDVKTAISFSDPAIVQHFRDPFKTLLGTGVDLVFCNGDEAKAFAGVDSVENAIPAIKRVAHRFAITLGENGAYLYDGNKDYKIEAEKADCIDTNGAGDLFAGAFLSSLSQGCDFEIAGKIASFACAKLVEKFGPRLDPTLVDEINYFKKNNIILVSN